MKRSISFYVEVRKTEGKARKCFQQKLVKGKFVDTGDEQMFIDFEHINKIEPYPRGNKILILKITYYLAQLSGKWEVSRYSANGSWLHFESSKNPRVTNIYNCMIENLDWPIGTRFNRLVEVINRKEKA